MKKSKKHQFVHQDPENQTKANSTEAVTAGEKSASKDTVAPFVYRDLKRTGYIIFIFILILAGVYLIQAKTDWLNPVFKLFGI